MSQKIFVCNLRAKFLECKYSTLAFNGGDDCVYTCGLLFEKDVTIEPCAYREEMVLQDLLTLKEMEELHNDALKHKVVDGSTITHIPDTEFIKIKKQNNCPYLMTGNVCSVFGRQCMILGDYYKKCGGYLR